MAALWSNTNANKVSLKLQLNLFSDMFCYKIFNELKLDIFLYIHHYHPNILNILSAEQDMINNFY